MAQISVQINLIVKADSQEEADRIVTSRLNDWFGEDIIEPPPLQNGSLLAYSIKKGENESE